MSGGDIIWRDLRATAFLDESMEDEVVGFLGDNKLREDDAEFKVLSVA